MTLYFIGIGLNDEKDITVKGLELVKKTDFVYLENYTAKINCNINYLEQLYGKKIILADRKLVEMDAEKTMLQQAKTNEVAFLVVGDVFSATTHMDLFLRAKKLGIKTKSPTLVPEERPQLFSSAGVGPPPPESTAARKAASAKTCPPKAWV